jgi:signal transduction histidine kinase
MTYRRVIEHAVKLSSKKFMNKIQETYQGLRAALMHIIATTSRAQWFAMSGVFVAYIIVGQLSLFLFDTRDTYPAVILTPAGIALAGTILYGYRILPAVALAALVNGILSATSPIILLFVTMGATLQTFAGACLLIQFRFNTGLMKLRDILTLIGVAIVVTTISPWFGMIGTALVDVSSSNTFGFLWLGNVFSIIILTPLLIRLVANPILRQVPIRLPGTLLMFLMLIIINFLVFWTEQTRILGFPVAIIQIVLLGVIALRWGMTRMTVAVFLTTLIALTDTYFGFADLEGEALYQKIVGIELYLILFATMCYVITAISEERDAALLLSEINMSNLEEAIQKIKIEDQKKSEFIAVLAHELRNPLAPIANYLEIMTLEGVKETRHRDAVEGIERQVNNIKLLLHDLLDISRISRGKIKLNREKVDVGGAIKSAVDSSRARIDARNHTLNVDLPASPIAIYADPLRIEQVLVNLLSNAAKYTPPCGTIWLSVTLEGKEAVIRLRDTGIGITKEALPTIFNMFNQADTSVAKTTEGLGVGLALVKMLTLLHGGSVEAQSEGVDKGSEFTVRIPVYDEGLYQYYAADYTLENEYSFKETPGEKEEVRASKNILIVDDNPDMLRTLEKLLTLIGHTVCTAHNGVEAIKKAHQFAPDTILLDLGLPGMSGYEIARTLRAELPYMVTMIAISGYGQKEDKIKSYNAGFDYHLTKPITRADIEKLL